jgi:hypothetical protein
MSDAWATVGERRYPLEAGRPFTFGRAEGCTARLDPDDATISRLAGSVEYDNGAWWLINRSSVRVLALVDELGLRSVVPPGRRVVLDAEARVVVDGSQRSHLLVISVPRVSPEPVAVVPPEGTQTSFGGGVLVSDLDRLAMVALFAGYLADPPRHDPNPRSYAAAAARLGWPKTTLVKRIEYLRTRLTSAGVPNLTGWNALPALAEYAITTRLITKEDLARISL